MVSGDYSSCNGKTSYCHGFSCCGAPALGCTGFNGCCVWAQKYGISDSTYRVGFEKKVGDNGAHHYFDAAKAAEVREAYMHPFWKVAGEIAKKVGGHGGMDFIMDLRWVYCLQNGLPMDTDVYDLATYSSVVELSERSVNSGSRPIEFPDYTRGGWKTAKPFAVEDMDISKFDFSNGLMR